jgi:hypothetical protein
MKGGRNKLTNEQINITKKERKKERKKEPTNQQSN